MSESTTPTPRLLLVDGSSYLYRAFFAGGEAMSTTLPDGTVISAKYIGDRRTMEIAVATLATKGFAAVTAIAAEGAKLALCDRDEQAVRANADRLGMDRLVLQRGRAPEALSGLPAPDAVFIGGGLSQALLATLWQVLQPGCRIVANAVTLESEAQLAQAQATSQVRAAVPGIIAILVGGIFVLASLFTMLAALIAWLAPVLGAGNAALVVTLGTAAVGGIAIALGSHHLNKRAVVPPVRQLPDLTGSTPQEEVK